jgi:hypothetical protein
MRLDLDTTHLSHEPIARADDPQSVPRAAHLRRAGSMLAAAWFELTGRKVAWPLEPCRYDLLVLDGGTTSRVQVKTTTRRVGQTWSASLGSTSTRQRFYDPDEVDEFFVIDGGLAMYRIPIKAVAGLTAIQLSAYSAFRLPPLSPLGP